MYDYFYGQQAQQFSFYRIPKVLFTEPQFKSLSAEAKTLYGILLDRMNLSAKNQWIDEAGRVYIIFTVDEIMEALGCARQKAVKLLAELDNDMGLIERRRQGLGRPNMIYVRNFTAAISEVPESNFQKFENHTSEGMKITSQEVRISNGNNTDMSNTEYSDTDLFSSSAEGKDEMRERKQYESWHLISRKNTKSFICQRTNRPL